MCVSKGMVRGKRQAVDSVFIKANASMDSLVEKEVLEDASAFVNELEENSEYKVTSTRKKLVERHHDWKAEAYKECQQIATAIKPTKTAISSVPNTCLITPIIRPQIQMLE